MKKILLIILFFVSWSVTNAQDKIITLKKDTIECRIVSVNADRISYEQKTPDNLWVGKSISTADVLQYARTAKADNPDDRLYRLKPIRQRPAHRLLFSLQGGLSHSFTDYNNAKVYLIEQGNSADLAADYTAKMKNGYHLNTSLHYLFTNHFGLGADYNFFYLAAKGEFVARGYGEIQVPIYTRLSFDEKLFIHFAGVSVLFREFVDKQKKFSMTQTITPGIVMYRNESRDNRYQPIMREDYYNLYPSGYAFYYDQANSVATNTTYGAKGSLSLDYALTPQLSVGLAGSFMWSHVRKLSSKSAYYEREDQDLAKNINIAHLDYGLTVCYNF